MTADSFSQWSNRVDLGGAAEETAKKEKLEVYKESYKDSEEKKAREEPVKKSPISNLLILAPFSFIFQ